MARYLFVDGAYLHRQFHDHMQRFYGRVPEFDFLAMAQDLNAYRTYYYDAIDYTKHDGETDAAYDARIERAEAQHDQISSLPGFHVRPGHVRASRRKKNREQKAVDVQLAVDALEHAARRNMELAMLLTGDLDFEPLLASLERLGVRTHLIYVPLHTSKLLMHAADEVQKITLHHFYRWSAPSFKEQEVGVDIRYNHDPPPSLNYRPARTGVWQGRHVTIFEPIQADRIPPLLFVERGHGMGQSSYTFAYVDIEALSLAFELTFGPIEWT